tara:strand:+ start:240 stop:458 length:219 start_codon:yes stop_codon:yes gene_type:complete
MEMFGIIKFTCSYDEWKSIYDGDIQLRKQFLKDDIIGKVDENTAFDNNKLSSFLETIMMVLIVLFIICYQCF